ncbi:ubiquitin-like domain-containing protein [Streptomyces sp. NPDC051561]|uniref:ubiquitin-like domain-containing protein n=1 Tax=Streptomyces sp. NPDC051561 TaxID=3365658 RepID=UPI0037BA5639
MSNTQGGALSYGEQYGGSSYVDPPYGSESYGSESYGAGHEPYGGAGYEAEYSAPVGSVEYDTYQPSYEGAGGHGGHASHGEHAGPEGYGTQDAYGSYEVVHGYGAAQDSPVVPGPAGEPDLCASGAGRGQAHGPDSLLPRQSPVPVPEGAGGRADGRRAARRRKGAPVAPGGGPAGAEKPDTLRKLVPQALVVAFLAGGTSAFIANDKSIELSVDGAPRTLHTFADDVTELLEKEGVSIGEHDLVAPGRGQTLASGDEVVVRYGRPVTLNIDGERRKVWTTAQTVDGALRQLGVRAEGAYLSASRSSPISRTGLSLDVRTERTLTLMADGRERTIRTNAATVEEAVEESGITLGNQDTTSVPLSSFPRDGQTVTIMRITGTREVREEPIDFEVVRRDDASLFKGTEEVVRPGVKGTRRVTYVLRTVNGVKQRPKKFSEEVAREPVNQVVRVGTKAMPTAVRGADGLDWDSLAKCESGGRASITDSSGTYGGLYQFDRQTWQSLGGSGAAHEAPAEEQTFRAKKLYVQRGASPWPHCGRHL